MALKHLVCGGYANQSERYAVEYLKARLQNVANPNDWALLSNYSSSSNPQYPSDELDLVVLAPSGISVIEIKHWSSAELKDSRRQPSEFEADKLNEKAKRLKGKIQRSCKFNFGFVEGKFLFTKNENEKYVEGLSRRFIRGVNVFGLSEWKDLLDVSAPAILSNEQIALIAKALHPQVAALVNDEIQNFDHAFFELKPIENISTPFRKVYRARRQPGRDKVVLHIYDLTASKEKNALEIARREFQILQRLQTSKWLPNLMDSFQEAKNYPGELYFFTYVDTEAPTLFERTKDENWSFEDRVYACFRSLEALAEIHGEGSGESGGRPILHRNLSPETIHIRSNGEPLLTQLHLAKLPGAQTVAVVAPEEFGGTAAYFAPEVQTGGIGASSVASDVFSLCGSLSYAFTEAPDSVSLAGTDDVLGALKRGLNPDPTQRPSLDEVFHEIKDIFFEPEKPAIELPDVQFWDETTPVELNGRLYKIITRLGTGGFGTAFKVMEVDPQTGDDFAGPFVAKAITEEKRGREAATAYARVRAQAGTEHLAGVLEVASDWKPNSVSALLRWIEGIPLHDLSGVLTIHIEDLGHGAAEDTVLLWLCDMCDALSQLHRVGLVHGDVSPKNIIVDGTQMTLTDFDTATLRGNALIGMTGLFCSSEVASGAPAQFSDDVYALGSTFFATLYDRGPFEYTDGSHKQRGLNWQDIDISPWTRLKTFLDRATSPNVAERFETAMQAKQYLLHLVQPEFDDVIAADSESLLIRTDNIVPWLSQLLQSYPGSPKGNAETRGLDSPFARQTYVETELDRILVGEIKNRRVSLVLLCGNAGDGKTAFLQNIATHLGLEVGTSAERIWDTTLADGLRVYANLDGSASYQGRSAKELLDECFAPFQLGDFPDDLVHLLAINDGKLLEWLGEQGEDSSLGEQLYDALSDDTSSLNPRIRFIDLNKRSLVGGFSNESSSLSSHFVKELLDKMLGEESDIWTPCHSCTAQPRCHAWASVSALRSDASGEIVRQRLVKALLAVHQRGEIHITARSLRAALVYIFFGTLECIDLHSHPNLFPEMYYDRAFDFFSPYRQGDLLMELSRLDPALESHPEIDRFLLKSAEADGSVVPGQSVSLGSLRRGAYFNWSEEQVSRIGGSPKSLGLAGSKYIEDFLSIGNGDQTEVGRICSQLCDGIARLEELPDEAFNSDKSAVPFKITPRTPTETAFWVTKQRDRFSLRPLEMPAVAGIETLHTHVVLSYSFENGHEEELIIGAELFNLLMELREGFQISDVQSDEIFANLSIFKQRLAQEGDRVMFAWNPSSETVMRIEAGVSDGRQKLQIAQLS